VLGRGDPCDAALSVTVNNRVNEIATGMKAATNLLGHGRVGLIMIIMCWELVVLYSAELYSTTVHEME
jgi:hypothetical protein